MRRFVLRFVAVVSLASLVALSGCDLEPQTSPAGVPLEAAMEKGGKKFDGGNKQPQPTGEPASFSFRDLGLFTDSAGVPYGDGSVQCDAEAWATLAGDGNEAGVTQVSLGLPSDNEPSCRRLWLEVDLRHDGFDGSGRHIDTPVPALMLRVRELIVHVDGEDRPTGTASISTETGYCEGSRRRGQRSAPSAFRFSPSGDNSIAGSTRLNVDPVVPGSKWRITSDESTVAGCAESSKKTTFWHFDIDFEVNADVESAPPPPEEEPGQPDEPEEPGQPDEPEEPGEIGDATIVVTGATTMQRIVGWEATAQAGQFELGGFPAFQNEVLDRTVNELGINRVRLEVRSGAENDQDYFELWQRGAISREEYRAHWYTPVNDNANAGVANLSGFQFGRLDASVDLIVAPMKQRVNANGERLYVSLCFVDFHGAPSVLVTDPDEYAEFMLTTFQHLQSKYGWVPDAIEIILEPELSTWSGRGIGRAIAATAERLGEAGFNPDFVAPSTTSMAAAVDYFDDMAEVPGALQALSEISYHRYAGVSGGSLDAIASRAQAYGLGTAMLEHIGSGYEALHEDLKRGQNTSWSQFTIAWTDSADDGGKYYLVDGGNRVELAKQARLLRQYMHYVRAGAQRVGAASSDAGLDPLAFINPAGQYVIVVKADNSSNFTIAGLPAGTYGINYATDYEYNMELNEVTVSGDEPLAAQIPARGVVTVYLKRLGS